MKVHDDVLEAAFLDGRDSPRVREHLATCAACRERLEELDRLSHDMEAIAAEEREDLAAARAAERAGEELDPRFEALLDEHRVRGARDEARLSLPPTPSRPWWKPVQVLVAAAAVLAIVFFGRQLITTSEPRGDGQDPGTYMGSERGPIELVSAAEDLPELRWSYDLPVDGHYQITIVDGATGEAAVRDRKVKESHWSPSDELLPVNLPEELVVTIRAFDSSGMPLDTLSGVRMRRP